MKCGSGRGEAAMLRSQLREDIGWNRQKLYRPTSVWLQSGFGPFPFQIGRIVARCPSVFPHEPKKRDNEGST